MATWREVSARLGRNDLPHALIYAVLVHHTLTDPDEIATGLAAAWVMCEWPMQAADADVWLNVWSEVVDADEYLTDDGRAPRADLPETLTVYRAAAAGHERGMSWTTDLAQARWFATRFGQDDHTVYVETLPRDAVLAVFNRRGEHEVVVDPDYLFEDVEFFTEVPEPESTPR